MGYSVFTLFKVSDNGLLVTIITKEKYTFIIERLVEYYFNEVPK